LTDLTTLAARLPVAHADYDQLTVARLSGRHTQALAEACVFAASHVKPWLGTALCPVTPAAVRKFIDDAEHKKDAGYGITYLMMDGQRCLGMGFINYIHPVHYTANLGFWIRPDACGKGLAVALCKSLTKLAFSQMQLHRLELFIEPANKASMKVAQKLGAQPEGLCRKRIFGRDAYLYALLAED